jgi:hypothetical protein
MFKRRTRPRLRFVPVASCAALCTHVVLLGWPPSGNACNGRSAPEPVESSRSLTRGGGVLLSHTTASRRLIVAGVGEGVASAPRRGAPSIAQRALSSARARLGEAAWLPGSRMRRQAKELVSSLASGQTARISGALLRLHRRAWIGPTRLRGAADARRRLHRAGTGTRRDPKCQQPCPARPRADGRGGIARPLEDAMRLMEWPRILE